MNKKLLGLLISVLCSGVVIAAQSKRTISIDDIAEEFGIVFVEKKQRGLTSDETRVVSGQTVNPAERELLVELGRRLLQVGGKMFRDGHLRAMTLPHNQTPLTEKMQQQVSEAMKLLDREDLPHEFSQQQRMVLPALVLGLLDLAHSLMGMVDEKIVPAVRAYLSGLMAGSEQKSQHVRFEE